jgi:hypothetical protein
MSSKRKKKASKVKGTGAKVTIQDSGLPSMPEIPELNEFQVRSRPTHLYCFKIIKHNNSLETTCTDRPWTHRAPGRRCGRAKSAVRCVIAAAKVVFLFGKKRKGEKGDSNISSTVPRLVTRLHVRWRLHLDDGRANSA